MKKDIVKYDTHVHSNTGRPKCGNTTKKTVKILYRTTKYGAWSPASINIPLDIKDVTQYCYDDLESVGIKAVLITIEKTIIK